LPAALLATLLWATLLWATLLWATLLILPTLMLDPATFVNTARIVMCPVQYAPFFIPLELAANPDGITGRDAVQSLCQVNVVGDQNPLPGPGPDKKSLVPAAIVVVSQQFDDLGLDCHDLAAPFGSQSGSQHYRVLRGFTRRP